MMRAKHFFTFLSSALNPNPTQPHTKGPDGKPVVVKKGTIVHVPHWLVHRSEKHWGEDALEFNPDRMGDKDFNRNRAFMPFTRPPRDCIGRNFAMMEMRTIIMYLVSGLARCRRVSDAYQF